MLDQNLHALLPEAIIGCPISTWRVNGLTTPLVWSEWLEIPRGFYVKGAVQLLMLKCRNTHTGTRENA